MKTVSVLFLAIIFPILCFGQLNTFAKGIVLNASENGESLTQIALANEQTIIFYTSDEDGLIYMSNYWIKTDSQSFGEIKKTKRSKNTKINNFKAEILYFDWYYVNTYNDDFGVAQIKFTKIYKPQGITFELKLAAKNNKKLFYKGLLVGDLNL